ncbi:hypothetical protein Tco_0744752 [Tanacetum coccineum]
MGKGTIEHEDAISTIFGEYLLEFTLEYGIREDLHPELPGSEETIIDFLEGKVGVYTKFFEFANYRIPLSQFLFDVLGYYQIHLSQLSVTGAAKCPKSCEGEDRDPSSCRPQGAIINRYCHSCYSHGGGNRGIKILMNTFPRREITLGFYRQKPTPSDFRGGQDWRIDNGMSEGLKHGVEHEKAKLDLAAIEAYDPEADAKYVVALHALKDLRYPLDDQLEKVKDAPIDLIMASLHLESDAGEDTP